MDLVQLSTYQLKPSSLTEKKKKTLSSVSINNNILKNLKSNEEFHKLRFLLNSKENSMKAVNQKATLSRRSSQSKITDSVKLSCSDSSVVTNEEKGMFVFNVYDKSQKDELTAIQRKVEAIIGGLEERQEEIIDKCDELWTCLLESSIVKEDNVLLSVKQWIRSSWALLHFTLIICYDKMNNNNEEREEVDDKSKSLVNIHNAFSFHSKIVKMLVMHFFSSPLASTDIIKFTQSFNCLLISIASQHKAIFSAYPPQKSAEYMSLWSKIPNISLASLTALYLKAKETPIRAVYFDRLPQAPYLSKQRDKDYTLVLDLDETLIHYQENPIDPYKATVNYRPGLLEFLENVSPYYELILFTMSLKHYADPIVDFIERERVFFQTRLYRDHCVFHKRKRVKDLTMLGRDPKSTIIIDDNEKNCFLQNENAILIKPYYGKDSNDLTLITLIPILVRIAKDKMDVRYGLKAYREEIELAFNPK